MIKEKRIKVVKFIATLIISVVTIVSLIFAIGKKNLDQDQENNLVNEELKFENEESFPDMETTKTSFDSESNHQAEDNILQFITIYFDTTETPYLSQKLSALHEKRVLTDSYMQELRDHLIEMDKEDAVMELENLEIFTNNSETFLAVFELTYQELQQPETYSYVIKVETIDQLIDSYLVVAVNQKIAEGE